MYFRLLLILAALGATVLLVRWFVGLPPERAARLLRRAFFFTLLAFLAFLAATGRLHWLFALAASAVPLARRLLPLLRYLPLLGNLYRRYQQASGPNPTRSPGQTSEIETAYLRMRLDHDTGAISGEVLEGSLRGRQLSELDLGELLLLRAECRAGDPDSLALLESYLDSLFGERWREAAESGAGGAEAATDGPMTRDEALQILGLEPGADRDQILAAHRRLMQRLHPDRGGSGWLATKLNQAKEVLLES